MLFSQNKASDLNFNITFTVTDSLIYSDSLTIIPSDFRLIDQNGITQSDTLYFFNNNKVFFTKYGFQLFRGDTIKASGRTMRVNLGRHYFHLDSNALKNTERAVYIAYDLGKNSKSQAGILPNSLDYDGSFSRGLALGNRQDLSLNSNFNIQMSGDIGGGILLRAAISDANIPFQPEGTTQRLNEFDKVFIELTRARHSVIAGDFEIMNPKGYFSRYFKKLKGIGYSGETITGKKYNVSNKINIAISKGKFNRISLKTINGNQGPYKLTGNSGEKYLIVLAGTEKVFLDGRLLLRGNENDYTIDYNLAEILFTPGLMITENSRITVEFEYSEQNYQRSLQAISSTAGDSIKNVYFNFYNEIDSKTPTGVTELDSADIQVLKNAGNNPGNTFRSGIRKYDKTRDYDEKIFYRTIYEPEIQDSVLVYTNNPDSALYIAYFTDFGDSNGSYQIENKITANGRIYKWVGKGKGRYEPKIQLVAPEKKQMISAGINYRFSSNNSLRSEISFSNNDQNRFSDLNENNTGLAGYFELRSKKNAGKLNIENTASYELTGKSFKSLNPYRPTEFSRDWNLQQALKPAQEHLVSNYLTLNYNTLSVNYTYSGFFRSDIFSGNKNELRLNYNFKGFMFSALGNIMKSNDDLFNTSFFRPKIAVSQKIGFLKGTKVGFDFENENNRIWSTLNDSLQKTSFVNDNYRFFINYSHPGRSSVNLYYLLRNDFLPSANEFLEFTKAKEIGLSGELTKKSVSALTYNLAFRKLELINSSVGNKRPESNLLGKINHNLKILKSSLSSVTIIEFGSGQQAKADFVFIRVAPGTGTHIWNDANKDGKEGKDEFLIIPGIDTANYIKFIQYNNEYVRANTSTFNNNIRVDLKKIIRNKDLSILRILSNISLNSLLRATEKTVSSEGLFSMPFYHNLPDTSILLNNLSYAGTLYYNLGDPNYDFNLGYRRNNDLVAQVGGFTKNELSERFTYFRIKIIKGLELFNNCSFGNKAYYSQFNEANNYDYDFFAMGNELQYLPGSKFQIKVKYNYSVRTNDSEKMEKAVISDFRFSGRLTKLKNSRLESSVSYIKINYSGSGNSYIELSMLDGLKNGNNFLWSIQFTRRMKNNLDVVIQYEGRKTGTSSVLHSARMQAKASF